MSSGSEAAPEASHRAARLKRAINALGALNLIASVALAAADAALIQAEHRTKPSLLRSLRRAL
jgi:hypothetical protein